MLIVAPWCGLAQGDGCGSPPPVTELTTAPSLMMHASVAAAGQRADVSERDRA